MLLPHIPDDKAQHFIYGCIAASIAQLIAIGLGRHDLARYVGVLAAIGIGVAKEIFDYIFNRLEARQFRRYGASLCGLRPAPHEVSMGDIVATVWGAIPTSIVSAVLIDG